jgi:antitoxin ParD1/3/4
MNVSLTRELESFVNGLVSSGMYYSASEVVRDGLRLLREQEEIKRIRTEELRKDILLGMEDLRAGRSKTFTSAEELAEAVKKGGRKKLASKKGGASE